jgi:hypothetical protein
MIFNTMQKGGGCDCIKCGSSPYEGMTTLVQREDLKWDHITICAGCLFKSATGEVLWNKALGKKSKPAELPMPEPITPRWFQK